MIINTFKSHPGANMVNNSFTYQSFTVDDCSTIKKHINHVKTVGLPTYQKLGLYSINAVFLFIRLGFLDPDGTI